MNLPGPKIYTYWHIPDTLNNIILIYIPSNYDHKVNFKKEYKAKAVIHYYLYKGFNHWTGCVMLIFLNELRSLLSTICFRQGCQSIISVQNMPSNKT